MRNRGIGRGRIFFGGVLLFAAVVVWMVGLLMSPHGSATAEGPEHVKTVVATFLRNAAIGTIVLTALSAYLLYPARRPKWPMRDWTLGLLIALLAGTSLYQVYWIETAVLS